MKSICAEKVSGKIESNENDLHPNAVFQYQMEKLPLHDPILVLWTRRPFHAHNGAIPFALRLCPEILQNRFRLKTLILQLELSEISNDILK